MHDSATDVMFATVTVVYMLQCDSLLPTTYTSDTVKLTLCF